MTALLMNEDQTVTILENIDEADVEKLNDENQVVMYENAIDFDYGY